MLTPQEVRELFAVVRSLVDEGLAVVFITHKLEEVMASSDRVVVMRDGRVVGETTSRQRPITAGLARMMVGRDVVFRVEKPASVCGATVLEVSDLNVVDERKSRGGQGRLVRRVRRRDRGHRRSERQRPDGAGRGPDRPAQGRVRLHRSQGARTSRKASARETIEAGVSHVPEDRQRRGLVLEFDLAENMILGDHQASTLHGQGHHAAGCDRERRPRNESMTTT